MNIWEAFLLAAAFTLVCAGYVGKKVIKIDLSGLLPKNWKRAKRRRLLAERRTPLQGAGLRDDIKKSFENVLLPLGRADKGLLPARMDKTFRRNTERQLELLKQRKLCREIRLADVVPMPKNDFKRWNDDGREWRESILQCCALERFASSGGEKLIQETYHKKAYARILQSRHVRNADRVGKKENYYADRIKVICPSCGAEVELNSQQTVCPYCGGVMQSDFYDWQTEAFEVYEEIGEDLQRALYLLASSMILFICVFLCLWLIPDIQVSLAVGFGVAIVVLASILIMISRKTAKQEKLPEEIVRYSENYLRSCIIGLLVDECTQAFINNEEAILAGEFSGALIEHVSEHVKSAYASCSKMAYKKIYCAKEVLDIELAGYRIFSHLIDSLTEAVMRPNHAYSKLLLKRVPEQYNVAAPTTYGKLQCVLDYVSGMTDVYALDLYQKITGMGLPAV